jgi:bifunctional N-acetylglucosamine-1-phosphate-uridyltransferase/glucosamine-1-phosphate-acetyltransferase GlmU-like protein
MITIILAGGLGKRMNSLLPKVLHIINDYPMIYYIIQNALRIGSDKILIVVGKYKQIIKENIDKYFADVDRIEYIDQECPNGTGHAVQCCNSFITQLYVQNIISRHDNILILSGDVPLINAHTLVQLLEQPNTLLITKSENPFGNGRIIFKDDKIAKIVEEKDCTNLERQIQYINCGIYNITVRTFFDTIPFIQNMNKASEFYLTDFVELAVNKGIELNYYELPKNEAYQVMNINTMDELVHANAVIYDNI